MNIIYKNSSILSLPTPASLPHPPSPPLHPPSVPFLHIFNEIWTIYNTPPVIRPPTFRHEKAFYWALKIIDLQICWKLTWTILYCREFHKLFSIYCYFYNRFNMTSSKSSVCKLLNIRFFTDVFFKYF